MIPTDFHIFQGIETTKQHLLLIVSAVMFHIPPSDPRDLTDSGQIARVRTNSQDEFVTKILPQNFGDAYHNVPTMWFLFWYMVLFLWHSKSSWVITILQYCVFFFGSTSFRDNPIHISRRYPFRLNDFFPVALERGVSHGFFRCLCTRCPSMNQQFTTTSATMPLRMLLATRITMNSWICSWLFIFPMGYEYVVFSSFFAGS